MDGRYAPPSRPTKPSLRILSSSSSIAALEGAHTRMRGLSEPRSAPIAGRAPPVRWGGRAAPVLTWVRACTRAWIGPMLARTWLFVMASPASRQARRHARPRAGTHPSRRAPAPPATPPAPQSTFGRGGVDMNVYCSRPRPQRQQVSTMHFAFRAANPKVAVAGIAKPALPCAMVATAGWHMPRLQQLASERTGPLFERPQAAATRRETAPRARSAHLWNCVRCQALRMPRTVWVLPVPGGPWAEGGGAGAGRGHGGAWATCANREGQGCGASKSRWRARSRQRGLDPDNAAPCLCTAFLDQGVRVRGRAQRSKSGRLQYHAKGGLQHQAKGGPPG
jgi:hypothetical protein